MSRLHIYAPKGYYLGQVRGYGKRTYKAATGKCKSVESAIAKASQFAKSLGTKRWHRLRVVWLDVEGWHEPHIVFEGIRK